MKKSITYIIIIFCIFSLNAQSVEKIIQTNEIKAITKEPAQHSPYRILVNELEQTMAICNGSWHGAWIFNLQNYTIEWNLDEGNFKGMIGNSLGNLQICNSEMGIFIYSNNNEIVNLRGKISCGISFILKKGSGYIVYYVDEKGYPGAVDTTGRIYSSDEAMEYLKEYDSEKYNQSKKRAAELQLYNDFISNRVLIWGETYYSPIKNMQNVYGEIPYIRASDLIQYDLKGYGYEFRDYLKDSEICIVSPEGKRLNLFSISEASTIYSTYTWEQDHSSSWYLGFGGNIYYYVAGKEYTEVFRIRRTWGDPDFYAMAINGYTEDEYGKYVNEVLPKMSKADLRLLRNTIFALYGVHFKSADLSKHFDKQVWYTDEGKSSGEIKLPAHRQKLVEMIQKLER